MTIFDNALVQAGILDEMLQDTLDMEEDEELEEEADAEVDKVLFELTDGKLGEVGRVGTGVPVRCPSNLRYYYSRGTDLSNAGRGRHGTGYGEVQTATECFIELMWIY